MKKLFAFVLVAMILGSTVIGCSGGGTTKKTEAVTKAEKDSK